MNSLLNFFAVPKPLSDESIVHDVYVQNGNHDPEIILAAITVDEADELVSRLQEVADDVIGKR